MRVRSYLEALTRYGNLYNGTWPNEAKWCVVVQVPEEVSARLINSATGLPTTHIYCNRDMAGPLLLAFKFIIERGLVHELETFDGCLMIRAVRGSCEPSTHCFALAIDLNAHKNPLGGPVTFSPELIKCFTDAGFSAGAQFHHRVDPMHF